MDFRQIFRTSKKDERITQLQGKITTLESDITWLKEQVAAKVERIDELKQQYEPALARYKELQERLDMAHEVETSQAEVIATQKQTITELRKDVSAGVERIRELEHDAAEYDVADDRFVQQIKDLQRDIFHLEADAKEHAQASARYVKEIAESQGECLAIASENSDLIMFVRKCATGANIRADKPGGAKLVADARALLKQYDSPVEVKEQ